MTYLEDLEKLVIEQRAKIEKLESQARDAGSRLDDRFRMAVDPFGESVNEKLGIKKSRTMTIVYRVVAACVILAVAYYAVRYFI